MQQWRTIDPRTIAHIRHSLECADTPLSFDELLVAVNDPATKSWARVIITDTTMSDGQRAVIESVRDVLKKIQKCILEHSLEVPVDESIVWRRIAKCFDQKISRYEARLKKHHH